MKINFTQKEKTALLNKFSQLKTIRQKFQFWENELQHRFIFELSKDSRFGRRQLSEEEREESRLLSDFYIQPRQDEALEWNTVLLESYKDTFERFERQERKKVWDLDSLVFKFEKELSEVTSNPRLFIEHKLSEVDALLQEKKNLGSDPILRIKDPMDMRGHWFEYGYKRQMFKDGEVELDQFVFDYPNLIEALNGVTIAKFRKYLNQKLSEPDTPIKEASRAQKMLLLNSLGVLEHLQNVIPSKTKLAKTLHLLIGASAENIEKDMTAMLKPKSKLKSVENYEFLINALDLAGAEEKRKEAENTYLEILKSEDFKK